MDGVVELLVGPRVEAELGEIELQRLLVENAEDGLLAEDRGQDRNAEVDLAGAKSEFDPAILGDASLGDVEVGHDLQTRDDRRLEALRWRDRKSTRLNSSH